MTILSALLTVGTSLAVFLIPGLAFVRRASNWADVFAQASRVVLWSITLLTLTSLILTMLHWPLSIAWILALMSLPPALVLTARREIISLAFSWSSLFIIVLLLAVIAVLSLPFFLFHDGLPTGDVQKAIVWSEEIIRTRSLPDYSQSVSRLNRDPVDFYTPGLHTFTALLSNAAPHPLIAVGITSLAAAVSVALIAAALAGQIFPHNNVSIYVLTFFFVLTNTRFLRYVREPGYHFQNVMGELLLFGGLFLTASLLHRLRLADVMLLVLTVITLAITHQFSAFIAVFILFPALALAAIFHRTRLQHFWRKHMPVALVLSLILILLLGSGVAIGLPRKIPHIFTATPHLLSLIPALRDYPRTLGPAWFIAGLAGLMLLTARAIKNLPQQIISFYFALTVFVLLLLSQGPRFMLDIPPVRALYYIVVPLSICAAYFLQNFTQRLRRLTVPLQRTALRSAVAVIVIATGFSSLNRAYALSHAVRTNSTLRAEYLPLIEQMRSDDGAVLVDDYNRRAASWLVLSGQPMFTRLAADLERQMDEASQTPLRRNLYLNQLDYEKIFALGSKPELAMLLQKHNIRYLTGILGSSYTAFQHNPALQPVGWADDLVLFSPAAMSAQDSQLVFWLLRASSLVNDIGDREDTFEHLPASLRSTRLSEPKFGNGETYRTTAAPLIPLRFNVGDYVRILWDKEKTGRPNANLELYISFAADPPRNLSVTTPSGRTHAVTGRESTVVLTPLEVPFDAKGFLTLTINNPDSRPLDIDLIALGPARVP